MQIYNIIKGEQQIPHRALTEPRFMKGYNKIKKRQQNPDL